MPEMYMLKHGHVSAMYEAEKDSDIFVNTKDSSDRLSLQFVQKHRLGNFVGGFNIGEVSVPVSRYGALKEVSPYMFNVVPAGNTFSILNVPLYKTHGDTRKNGHVSNAAFVDRLIKNHYTTKAATKHLFGSDDFAWLPKFHLGHTPNNPDLPERECIAFIDNLYRVEDFLFGDLLGLSKNDLDLITSGKYPDRSAEVDTKRGRLLSVAALGFRTPHFGLPQMNPLRMRQQYEELVQKHLFEDVSYVTFSHEDLKMPKNNESLSAVEAAKFFARLQLDSELNEQFEAAKDEAIQKYMGINGGMMPGGPDLVAIIQQIMSQLMSQKMNTDPAGGSQYQNNASDILDFESIMHNEADKFEDFEEEGTDVAGPDDAGLRKGSQGDHPVDKVTGVPSTSDNSGEEGDDSKVVATDGSLVERSVMEATDTIKHALTKLPKDSQKQVQSAFDTVLGTVDTLTKHVMTQGKALENLNKANEQNRINARKTKFQAFLESQFKEGNASVNSKDKITRHMKLLLTLNESQADEYMRNIADTPALSSQSVTRHRKEDLISPDTEPGLLERNSRQLENDGLKKLVSADAYAIAELWGNLD